MNPRSTREPAPAVGGRAPVLIFGYGNPSRGDDALGPELLERTAQSCRGQTQQGALAECLTDFQLQVEHALDLQGRQLVLFVDASVSAAPPYEFAPVHPARDDSYTTHAMSPTALLKVFDQVFQQPPPPCYLLSIRGYEFDLGRPLSAAAAANLDAGVGLVEGLLRHPHTGWWQAHAASAATDARPSSILE